MTLTEKFDAAQALYWYCANYHEGQGSVKYRILCELQYAPGFLEHGIESDSEAGLIYNDLEQGLIEPQELLTKIQTEVIEK